MPADSIVIELRPDYTAPASTLPKDGVEVPYRRKVRETVRRGSIPLRVHAEWKGAFPWLRQGISVRSAGDEDLDFGLFTPAPASAVMARWERLAHDSKCPRVVHGRQLHRSDIIRHGRGPQGLLLAPPCDGHMTEASGTLLTIVVADCVPVFAVAPRIRAVMLLHAGWRGTAAGILERGLAMFERRFGARPGEVHLHLGPAICGDCYETGREVHRALGLPRPASPAAPVDLRWVLAGRALRAGVKREHVTGSEFCTRCADTPFFSHRAGDAGRQVAVLGVVAGRARRGRTFPQRGGKTVPG